MTGHQWHKTPGVIQVGRPQDTAYWNPLDKGFKVQLGDNRTIYAVEYTPGGVEVSLTWDGEETGADASTSTTTVTRTRLPST